MRDTQDLRACSSEVRTFLMTSVTVFLVVENLTFLLIDLLSLAAFTAALSLAPSARLTWMRTSRSTLCVDFIGAVIGAGSFALGSGATAGLMSPTSGAG